MHLSGYIALRVLRSCRAYPRSLNAIIGYISLILMKGGSYRIVYQKRLSACRSQVTRR